MIKTFFEIDTRWPYKWKNVGCSPLKEPWVELSVSKTSSSHPDVLQEAQVLHLVLAALMLKQ